MMDPFSLLIEEFLEDCGTGDGLDYFVDYTVGIVRGNGCVAKS